MTRERWIVVGTDFSDGSRAALERALRMAEDSKARIALVHAYEEGTDVGFAEDPTPLLMRRLEEQIASSGAERRGIKIDAFVRRGPPWDKILNVATECGAELIVLGGSGQRGFSLGSVTSRVLSLSKRCVLVARAPLNAT